MKKLGNYSHGKKPFKKAFRIIDRQSDVVLAQDVNDPDHFEVFQVCKSPDREIGGALIPASEHPPSSNEWGWPRAVTCRSRERAEQRFRAMVGHHKPKTPAP